MSNVSGSVVPNLADAILDATRSGFSVSFSGTGRQSLAVSVAHASNGMRYHAERALGRCLLESSRWGVGFMIASTINDLIDSLEKKGESEKDEPNHAEQPEGDTAPHSGCAADGN